MIEFNVFPNGKTRVVTFSYDDGHPNDFKLIDLFNKYGLKGTFHLNGHHYLNKTDDELLSLREKYKGHEISCHTLNHGFPTYMANSSLVNEILKDREILEKIAGYPVLGMSYPYGAFDDRVLEAMRSCGIVYSRTTKNTNCFYMPSNFLLWDPTCHQRDALFLSENFMADIELTYEDPLLYIWGHSYELKTEEDWAKIEKILKTVAGDNRIWYATNIEIYDYLTFLRQLKISADEKIITNPTAFDLWILKDGETVKIPKGETVNFD